MTVCIPLGRTGPFADSATGKVFGGRIGNLMNSLGHVFVQTSGPSVPQYITNSGNKSAMRLCWHMLVLEESSRREQF